MSPIQTPRLAQLTKTQVDRVVASGLAATPSVHDIYPLSPMQQRIFKRHLSTRVGDPHLKAKLLRFTNRTTLDRFLTGLQRVIDRHESLRIAIWCDEMTDPLQVAFCRVTLPVEELVFDPSTDASSLLRERYNPRWYRLDLRRAPMMRCVVAHDVVNDHWAAVWLLHHLCADRNVLAELRREVKGVLAGREAAPPLPYPVRDCMTQARLAGTQQAHKEFFRKMLSDVHDSTAPFGRPNIEGSGAESNQAKLKVEAPLCVLLRKQALKLGADLKSLLHVAWAQVVARTASRPDAVFGTVLRGRIRGGEGEEGAVGILMNILPVRIQLGGVGVQECVYRTHRMLAELILHEYASITLAQQCSGVPSSVPLFTAVLDCREHLPREYEGVDTRAWGVPEEYGVEERTTFPLYLSVDDQDDSLCLEARVDAPIDANRICAMMGRALEDLAEALRLAPARGVGSLDVLPLPERHRLLFEWNGKLAQSPPGRFIHQLFEEQVERAPEATALIYEGERLTYAELNSRANRLAYLLQERGIKCDDRVAICVKRGLFMVIGVLGILKAGGAYVPLDPAYPTDRLAYILDDSGPIVILTHVSAHDALAAAMRGLASPPPLVDLESELRRTDLRDENLDPALLQLTSHHLAYVIYTSGSTGRPKGVMVEHRGVVAVRLGYEQAYGLHAGLVHLQMASISFDIFTADLIRSLTFGATLVICARHALLDPVTLLEVLQRNSISFAEFVPVLLAQLIGYLERAGGNLSFMRTVICTGDLLTAEAADRLRRACGPTVQAVNAFGVTEATIDSTYFEIGNDAKCGTATIPIGRPLLNTRIYILDEAMELVPQGIVGEIYIGGQGVARGYLNRPELTAERFVTDPFRGQPTDRLYKTGDLGRWRADGNIELLGRNDFQVKIRGFRIELGEIEAQIACHPQVMEAVVLAREDARGEKRLVAYVRLQRDGELSRLQLRQHLSNVLPEYMIPREFVTVERFPVTPNGKLDRSSLPTLAESW